MAIDIVRNSRGVELALWHHGLMPEPCILLGPAPKRSSHTLFRILRFALGSGKECGLRDYRRSGLHLAPPPGCWHNTQQVQTIKSFPLATFQKSSYISKTKGATAKGHRFLESVSLSASRCLVIKSSRDCHRETNINKYTRVNKNVWLEISKMQAARAPKFLPGILHPCYSIWGQTRSKMQVRRTCQRRKIAFFDLKNVWLKISTDISPSSWNFYPLAS